MPKTERAEFDFKRDISLRYQRKEIGNDIALAERELGILTDNDRLIEASLFIYWKFIRAAVITGQTDNLERSFGDKEWLGWLEARKVAKDHLNDDLTPELISELHNRLYWYKTESGSIRRIPL